MARPATRTRSAWPALALIPLIPATGAALELRIEEEAVEVSGATAGGEVVFASVAREPAEFVATIVPRSGIVADGDGDGGVIFALGRPVPLRSLWAAVDLPSGAYAVATPDGYPLRSAPASAAILGRGPGGDLDQLTVAGEFLEILVVRPGAGAWGGTLYDGGAGDQDGPANGQVTAALPALVSPAVIPGAAADAAVAGGGAVAAGDAPAAPPSFQAGDLLVVLDADRMELLVLPVTEALLAAADEPRPGRMERRP